MEPGKIAMLCPGQGACYPGVLRTAASAYPPVRHVVEEIDAIARERFGRSVTGVIWDHSAPRLEQLLVDAAELVQLAIYATSIAAYRQLAEHDVRPDVMVGHSFGEIAALACAGMITVRQGAEIVCGRAEATRLAAGSGYMAALSADAATVGHMVALVGAPTVLAAENAPTQAIVSGTRANMDRIGEIAKALNIGFTRLNSPCPFHSSLMEGARRQFRTQLAAVETAAPRIPVFSPILDRYYESDDVLAECLSEHLVRPVRFSQAIARLHAEGVRTFVEVGALDALVTLAKKSLPSRKVRTVATFSRPSDELGAMRDAIATLGPLASVSRKGGDERHVLSGLGLEHADGFWAAYRVPIEQFVRDRYAEFRANGADAVPAAPPTLDAAPLESRVSPKDADRATIMQDLVAMYARALEYPEEIFTDIIELEAELGIDSVKQTELLTRAAEKYGLPQRPAELRLAEYPTMGHIVDFILSRSPSATSAAPVPAPMTGDRDPLVPARPALFLELRQIYAKALEYPEEVFSEDVELEAELGIDSVKQTELLARVFERYHLPSPGSEMRPNGYGTLGVITDLVLASLEQFATSSTAAI
jgi:malonyl CoA-acyl carrier protein transacylase/acyl carrier protein